MFQVSRRSLLQASAVGAVAGPLAVHTLSAPAAAATTSQFTGHVPGKIYLGLTGGGFDITSRTGPVGMRRTFYQWNDITRELKNVKADHAANRMPWTSFKPPGSPGTTWKQIGDGVYDADIRARARSYATLTRPVIVTFNHEPQTDKDGPPAEYARAWCRIHDVMKAETGLKNIISAPILGEWTWNPINRKMEPDSWVNSAVLSRCHFLGVDLYQNSRGETYEQRVGRIFSWLDARGHSTKMVGLGETACSDDLPIKGATWWKASWTYAVARSDRFFGACYFNSLNNNNQGYNWLLTQSTTKLAAFTESVKSTATTKLPA